MRKSFAQQKLQQSLYNIPAVYSLSQRVYIISIAMMLIIFRHLLLSHLTRGSSSSPYEGEHFTVIFLKVYILP